jgi:hypothetical protein
MRLGGGVALALVWFAVANVAGCSSFTADTTPVDGGADGTASETGADAGTDGPVGGLLDHGDFEVPDCGGWTTNVVDTFGEPVAHAGMRSCKVCPQTGTVGSMYQDHDIPGTVMVGATYSASAWLRAPVVGSAATAVRIGIATETMGGAPIESQESRGVDLTDTWQRVNVSLPVMKPVTGAVVSFSVVMRGGTTDCVLVDDATLTVTP